MTPRTMRFLVGVCVSLCLLLLITAGMGLTRLSVSDGSGPLPDGPQCTMEARLCPDGSAVGRTGPNCEFAACPVAPAVTDFESCVAAGHPVMESYPRQCAASGQTYVETVAPQS